MKLTILALAPPDLVPSQRFRFEQWLTLGRPVDIDWDLRPLLTRDEYFSLYKAGHPSRKAVIAGRSLARRWLDIPAASRADVILIHREAFQLGPPLIERLIESRVPVVYDFDDAIFHTTASSANPLSSYLKQPSKVGRVIEGAKRTTVGNEYLADYARRYSDDVTVIPTTVDIERYTPIKTTGSAHEPVRIGWSGTFSTTAHLHTIDGALRRILTANHATMSVLGCAQFEVPGAARQRVRAKLWSQITEREDVGAFDIGVMPLPDNPFTRGKCGFKVLLYMALGVPCVASPVGVNRNIIDHGVNGLLASTEDEWVEALELLINDSRTRTQLAAAGRRTVVEQFAGQRWAKTFLDVLRSAAEA